MDFFDSAPFGGGGFCTIYLTFFLDEIERLTEHADQVAVGLVSTFYPEELDIVDVDEFSIDELSTFFMGDIHGKN